MENYKEQCKRLQKLLIEKDDTIRRITQINSELTRKLEQMKIQTTNPKPSKALRNLNELSPSNIRQNDDSESDISVKLPKSSEMTATGHLVFSDPILRIQELMKRKIEPTEVNSLLKELKDHLQLYMKKNKILLQELNEKKMELKEVYQENEKIGRAHV